MSANTKKSTVTETEIANAIAIWELVKDTSKLKDFKVDLTLKAFNNILREVSMFYFEQKTPRQEVLITAKFIANIDPSYKNSQGQAVPLSYIRSLLNVQKDDLDYIVDKLYDEVKSFISVSTETVISGLKLKVETNISKKRLINAALMHLITGSEVIADPNHYDNIKEAAVLAGAPQVSYALLIGSADKLGYPSVFAMMEDLVLTFIDQEENIKKDGKLLFYDGSVRVEKL